MNNDGCIHFDDGTPLGREFEALYLGNEMNRTVNIKHEVLNKISDVRRTWFKLNPCWKATRASKKWIACDLMVRSQRQLLYGLETIHLTQALSKSLDAFQIRNLRKILGRQSAFIDRQYTNQQNT